MSSTLVMCGAVIMLISIIKTGTLINLVKRLPERRRTIIRFLNVHRLLMIFFFLAYILVSLAFVYGFVYKGESNNLIVSIIFFFGALFVLLGVLLQKKMMLEIQGTIENLEQRVHNRTSDLAKTKEKLEQQLHWAENARTALEVDKEKLETLTRELTESNEDLERFVYFASHDLQEPLRKITGFINLFSSKYTKQFDQKADEYIHYITDGATRMQELIQGILTYSRISTRDDPFEVKESDCILDRALAVLDFQIEKSNAAIIREPLPKVKGDERLLIKLFQNLIDNAIKFHSDKTPRIIISAEEIVGNGNAKMWQFSVKDNGIGIDPENVERVFKIFQRLHTQQEYPGTGVGLAICRKITKKHGGTIWFNSRRGEGTTFQFTMPVVNIDTA